MLRRDLLSVGGEGEGPGARPGSHFGRYRTGALAIGMGVALAISVAGCGTVRVPHHRLSSPSGPPIHIAVPPTTMAEHQTWLLTAQALRDMAAVEPITSFLKSATVLELVGAAGTLYPGLPASAVMSFRSEAEFARWTPRRGLPSPRAVLYDPEHWAFTPSAEQQNVELYATRFVSLARSRSELPILAPGLDLVEALGPGGGSLATRYLTHGIPREMARALGGGPGVLEIQAQSQERSVSAYRGAGFWVLVEPPGARGQLPRVRGSQPPAGSGCVAGNPMRLSQRIASW
jgi:hypothetical protein